MIAIIVSEHDGWNWRIEPQDGCSDGVDLVYEEIEGGRSPDRTCLGSLEDAEALANAILAYVSFKRTHGN